MSNAANTNRDSSGRTYGAKYDRNLGVTAIAKRVREDVKDAIKSGELPAGLNVSVRISRYSMGQSIDLTVKACPFNVANVARVAWDMERPHEFPGTLEVRNRLNAEALALQSKLERMLQAYNHDGSDTMTDHFDVNFYGHAEFCNDLESAHRSAVRANLEDARHEALNRAERAEIRADEAAVREICPGWPHAC